MDQGDSLTVRRALLTVILLGSILAVITGCSIISPPTATFEIIEWTQGYRGYLRGYDIVWVYFKVTNTGTVNIDYYEVWIEVTCVDGSKYQECTNGSNVLRGSYINDDMGIDTLRRQASSVSITHYELTSY